MDEYSEYHKVIFLDYRSPRSIKQILLSGQLEIYFIAMKCIYNTNWPILNLDVNETVSNCRITVCVFKNNMTKCIRCIRRNRIDIFGIILSQQSEAVARTCSVKKVFLKISQNSEENTCTRVSFLIKLKASGLQLYKKRDSSTGFFLRILRIFYKHLLVQNTSGGCFYTITVWVARYFYLASDSSSQLFSNHLLVNSEILSKTVFILLSHRVSINFFFWTSSAFLLSQAFLLIYLISFSFELWIFYHFPYYFQVSGCFISFFQCFEC